MIAILASELFWPEAPNRLRSPLERNRFGSVGVSLGKEGRIVPRFVDKPFDWVAILALASGAAVLVPSLAALGMTLVAVIRDLV